MELMEFFEKTAFFWLLVAVIITSLVLHELMWPLETMFLEFIARGGGEEKEEK